jgi:hypothetical protein
MKPSFTSIILGVLTAVAATSFACGRGSDGFPGTYVAYGTVNWGAFVLEPGGQARYESTFTTDDGGEGRRTQQGTYRIVGDTAIISIEWADGDRGMVRATLRGDTLATVPQFFAPFVRGRLP